MPAAPTNPPVVVAVVVAYNRRDLLLEALTALQGQSRPVDQTVVIDNASTDDSAAVASVHPLAPSVISLGRNTGGAGGFAAGIAVAVDRFGADLVWLMDDDTIPRPQALEELLAARNDYPGQTALLGSSVVWHDGRLHPMNTPRTRPGVRRRELDAARGIGATPVRSSSFVSMLVDASAVRGHGLPVADYFIWNDDFEYSMRLLRRSVGLAVACSVVEHRTKTFGATDADPGERFFFEVRNKIWLLRFSPGLSFAERVLYAGASVRRWARTFARSTNRAVLWSAARQGWRSGWRTRPRATSEVLANLGEVSEAVARLEAGVVTGRNS